VSPRDVVAACLPDPAGLGDRIEGRTLASNGEVGSFLAERIGPAQTVETGQE